MSPVGLLVIALLLVFALVIFLLLKDSKVSKELEKKVLGNEEINSDENLINYAKEAKKEIKNRKEDNEVVISDKIESNKKLKNYLDN